MLSETGRYGESLEGVMKRMHLGVCGMMVVLFACLAGEGCSASEVATTEPSPLTSTIVSDTSSVSSEFEGGSLAVSGFDGMRAAMAPVPVFGLLELPEGVQVADGWWPVVEASPSGSTSTEANPRVSGQGGAEPEAQLVLTYEDGWLVVLENVRGDLGDVVGEPVGSIAGAQASLYEVNGGWLVQWGYEGRWYGVFGRDVPQEVVTALALEMKLL